MAYGNYYMQPVNTFYCPFMMGGYPQQNPAARDEQLDAIKKAGGTEIPYDASQYRFPLLPLLAIPLLFAAAGPRPFYGPGPYWGPPPFYQNYYWYYYQR